MIGKPKHDIDRGALAEYQRQIDEHAQNVVANVKRVIASREVLEPGCSAVFAKAHAKWYDATQRELSAAGFEVLGDYQVAGATDTPDDKRSFYRLALSADRTIVASWFVVPAKEPRGCVVLGSSYDDGSDWVTSSGTTDNGLPNRPGRTGEHLPLGTPAKALVERHRAKGRPGQPLVRVDGVAGVLASRRREAEAVAEHRRGLGLALFEPMLRTMYGPRFDEQGVPVLVSIHQHPEWWDDRGAAARPAHYEVITNKWALAQSEDENGPLVIRINQGVDAIRGHADFAHQLGIAIPLNAPNAAGYPDRPEQAELSAIEQILIPDLERGQESILTLVLTGGGVREFVLYTRSPTTVRQRVSELAARVTTHEVQSIVQYDPQWLVYDSYTRVAPGTGG